MKNIVKTMLKIAIVSIQGPNLDLASQGMAVLPEQLKGKV